MTSTRAIADGFIEKVNAAVYEVLSNSGYDQYHDNCTDIAEQYAINDNAEEELIDITQLIYRQSLGLLIDVRNALLNSIDDPVYLNHQVRTVDK